MAGDAASAIVIVVTVDDDGTEQTAVGESWLLPSSDCSAVGDSITELALVAGRHSHRHKELTSVFAPIQVKEPYTLQSN